MSGSGRVQLKAVYTIVERPNAKSRWVRIGIGFVNHDGSVNVRLDAMPVNGTLHIRDHRRLEDSPGGSERGPNASASLDGGSEGDWFVSES